ncbi:MAG: YdcF family protein [Burkholderiales bacterium]|nr:YdcF family protein [Burkholderiales bacterium]
MLDVLFVAKKLAGMLVLPPTGPLLLALAGLLLMRRRPRLGKGFAWLGVGALLLLSLPAVESGLSWLLYRGGALEQSRAQEAEAIVILGGGLRREAPEYGGDTLGRLTLDRVRYGARVARQTGLPVLVTGGSFAGSAAEADVMARALEDEYGVAVRWRERRSHNTHENAVLSAEILRAAGVRRVLLVSHAFDVPRAAGEFEAAGIRAIPAPTHVASFAVEGPLDFVPNMASLHGSYYACYELLANAARSVGL